MGSIKALSALYLALLVLLLIILSFLLSVVVVIVISLCLFSEDVTKILSV